MSHSRPNPIQVILFRVSQWLTRNERVVPWLLFSGLTAIYLAFPTRNYYWDGITFARTIESAREFKSLIHPSHLLYNVVGYLFFHLLQTVGLNLRAITALQTLNGLLSASAAVVFFSILKSSFRSLYLATFLTLLFGLSATWWKFSSDADAYIISVLLILISFRFILPHQKPRPLVVAILYAASMCFHQLAIFFGPVLMVGLAYQTKRKLSSFLQFGLVSVGLTTAAYFYCFHISAQSINPQSFLRWVTYYSPDASFSFSFWHNLGYTLRGNARLFLSGRFNLLEGLINPIIVILLVLLVIVFCFLGFLLVRNFQRPGINTLRKLFRLEENRPLLILSLVWLSIYLLFLFVWLPQNTFYRLFYLPSLVLIIGLLARVRDDKVEYQPKYRLAVFTVAVGLVNFLFFIFPYSHVEKFPPTRFALEMNQLWTTKTVIFYGFENADENLVGYFAPNTMWVRLSEPVTLENEVKNLSAQGFSVWLETTAIDQLISTPEGAEWLKAHENQNSRRQLKDRGFRIEFVQVLP